MTTRLFGRAPGAQHPATSAQRKPPGTPAERAAIQPPIVAPLAGRARRRRWRLSGALALRTRGGRPWAWTLFWAGLALAASVRLVTIALDPILATYHSSLEIRTLEAEYAAARETNERLHRQIAYLNSRAGIEEEARRLGWVRAGELPLRIVRGPIGAATAAAAAAAEDGHESGTRPGEPAAAQDGQEERETPKPPRRLNPLAPNPSAGVSGPVPRTPVAEQIQQALANWGVTKWLGEALKGSVER